MRLGSEPVLLSGVAPSAADGNTTTDKTRANKPDVLQVVNPSRIGLKDRKSPFDAFRPEVLQPSWEEGGLPVIADWRFRTAD